MRAPRLAAPFLVLLALAVFASPAGAVTLVLPDGTERPQPYQAWADAAHVPTPSGTVTLHLTPCPVGESAAGCVLRGQRAIHLDSEGRNRRTLLHELGHVFDQSVLTAPFRDRFQALVRRRGAWAGAASTDPAEEKFAEAYAVCAQHRALRDNHFGMYDYTPSPRLHRRVCGLIRRAAAAAPAR